MHYGALTGNVDYSGFEDAGLQLLTRKKTHIAAEPGLIFGVGTGGIKYNIQLLWVYGIDELTPVTRTYGGLSLTIRLNPLHGMRKRKSAVAGK